MRGFVFSRTKQRSSTSFRTTSFCYSYAKSTLLVPLTFNRVKKTKHEIFNFVHLRSSFFLCFSARHDLESIRCMQTLNTPNNYSANLLHSYLFWASCELQVASYGLKAVPKMLRILMHMLLGFSCNNCVGMTCIVRPHLDYWTRAVQAATSLLATNCV